MTPLRTALLCAGLLFATFLVSNLAWLDRDLGIRDGDEEGHVGAAELFLQDLSEARGGRALHRAFVADMGDYPSLYPAAVGPGWWGGGGGLPSRLPVRMIHLLAPLLAAGAVYSLARGTGRGPALVAAGTVLHLPMVAGIGRHFMPEGLLVATVALAIAAAQRPRAHPVPASAALLGLALAMAFLTKQTALLFLSPLLLLCRPHRSLLWALPTAALALPWTLTNLGEQLPYLAGSAGLGTDRGLAAHLLFYPRSLWAPALGPIWLGLVAGAAAAAWRTRHRRLVLLGLAWLGGSILLLTLVPRKYDRMLAPALPGAALILAAGVAARPRLAWLSLLGAGWTTWLSYDTNLGAPSAANTAFQTGCPQVWLRPPQEADPGFGPIVETLQAGDQERVVVLQAPEIPCSIQTTFGWGSHLGPFLRRAGVDRNLAQDEVPQPGDLVVDFDPAAPGEAHPVPLLDTSYRIRTP